MSKGDQKSIDLTDDSNENLSFPEEEGIVFEDFGYRTLGKDPKAGYGYSAETHYRAHDTSISPLAVGVAMQRIGYEARAPGYLEGILSDILDDEFGGRLQYVGEQFGPWGLNIVAVQDIKSFEVHVGFGGSDQFIDWAIDFFSVVGGLPNPQAYAAQDFLDRVAHDLEVAGTPVSSFSFYGQSLGGHTALATQDLVAADYSINNVMGFNNPGLGVLNATMIAAYGVGGGIPREGYTHVRTESLGISGVVNRTGYTVPEETVILPGTSGHSIPNPEYLAFPEEPLEYYGHTEEEWQAYIDELARRYTDPIILDLDGNGISVTELTQSTQFVDGGDGLLHRTAWAAAGDGVLFFDTSGDGQITEKREYVFTDWDPSATSDLEALRSVFDKNGDGKLTAADSTFASFKVMPTNAIAPTVSKPLRRRASRRATRKPMPRRPHRPSGFAREAALSRECCTKASIQAGVGRFLPVRGAQG